MKLTTATYWRPSGQNIHRAKAATEQDDWGVRPSDPTEIELTDEQAIIIAKDRQRRDILPTEGEEPPAIDPEDAVVDPQLQRAIEYLQEQIIKSNAPSVEALTS